MEFHVIELPKLPKELKEGDTLLLWAKFINAERKEEFDRLATKNAYIQSAYDQLQMISQDRQKRLEYEAREKAVLDYNQLILEAEQKGEQHGMEKLNALYAFLIREKRYADLERSTTDAAFQQQLMSEYEI